MKWYDTPVNTPAWQIFNFYDAVARWGVPVFVMISGALFLDSAKRITIKKIFQKNIFRILCAFCFWSLLYVVKEVLTEGFSFKIILHFIAGHYHMWFLFMIVGLYLVVPFLRRIVADKEEEKYFLVLSLVFAILVPRILSLDQVFPGDFVAGWMEDGQLLYKKTYFYFTMGYVGYFVLGHYLRSRSAPSWLILLCSVGGFAGTVGISAAVSLWRNEPIIFFYDGLSLPVLMESVAVFCFVRNKMAGHIPSRMDGIVQWLSERSFGIYLAHAFIIEIFALCGVTTLSFSPIISVPALSFMTFIAAAAVSEGLHHIPVLNRYIV